MLKEFFNILKSDSLFDQALSECYEMLDIVDQMFKTSTKSLRQDSRENYPSNIYEMDKKINHFERDVRRKIMTHLTVNPQQDLSSGLALVSVVIDIERMGDYTKNIYDLAIKYPKKLDAAKYEPKVSKMEQDVTNFLKSTIESFKSQDVDLGSCLFTICLSVIISCKWTTYSVLLTESDVHNLLPVYMQALPRFGINST